MIAKKHPLPEADDGDQQTRKVDTMSEIVAGMLLDDHETAPSAPSPSPGSTSAVRPASVRPPAPLTPQGPPASVRPPPYVIEPAPPPRTGRMIAMALIVGLGLVAVGAALYFIR